MATRPSAVVRARRRASLCALGPRRPAPATGQDQEEEEKAERQGKREGEFKVKQAQAQAGHPSAPEARGQVTASGKTREARGQVTSGNTRCECDTGERDTNLIRAGAIAQHGERHGCNLSSG
ncbi:MAG: hypothetical protein ACPG77_14205, partial [Nannocystaceae bacterium]